MLVKAETLERLRSSVQVSVQDWSAMLEIPTGLYSRMVDAPQIQLSETVLDRLARSLEIDPQAILNGTIDYKLLSRRAAGHATALPDRYSLAAHSRVRTSAYLLDYVEMTHGWQVRERILRQFQMNESIIADPEMKISVRFLADLCDYLQAHGYTRPGLHQIGKFSSVSNSKSKVAALLGQQGSPEAAYERCFTELIGPYWDQNNIYSIHSLGRHHCTVGAVPHPRLLDETDGEFLSTANICMAKAGGFASIMEYLGLPDAIVTEVQCIHRGDPGCRFEIDFEDAARTFQRQMKSRAANA